MYSRKTLEVLEIFSKGLTDKGPRAYQQVIGVENNHAAITDGYSLMWYKSEELSQEKVSLTKMCTESPIRFPAFTQLIPTESTDDARVDAKTLANLCCFWKPSNKVESFISIKNSGISLRVGKPQEEEDTFFLNPVLVSRYIKLLPKGYEAVTAAVSNGGDVFYMSFEKDKTKINLVTMGIKPGA